MWQVDVAIRVASGNRNSHYSASSQNSSSKVQRAFFYLQTGDAMMQRAPRPEVNDASWVRPEPFEYCLDCWRRWMDYANDRDLDAKTMNGLVGEGDGHGVNPWDAQRANDRKIAEATDAMIESLCRLHIWAIYKANSLGTPWRFPNADLVAVYADARAELEKKLRANTCTAVLF